MKIKNPKLTFLMSAHNEEKLISLALSRLVEVHKDYPKMEVLIGMDGCTDKTPEIVNSFAKKHKFFKPFVLNERKGKQAVLEKLEPHITGDIVIIHDADWTLTYTSKQNLLDYLKIFEDEKIGGVVESVDSEMTRPDFPKIRSLGFLASAWGNHLLLRYMKKTQTVPKPNLKYVRIYDKKKTKFYPFLDVYKKKVMDLTKHKSDLQAGDHVERTLRIFNAGYEVATFNNENWPHFLDNYNKQSLKDFLNQKVRGTISKGKLQKSYSYSVPLLGFYFPFLLYLISSSLKTKRFIDFFAIHTYIFVLGYATILSKIKSKLPQKDVWALRIKR